MNEEQMRGDHFTEVRGKCQRVKFTKGRKGWARWRLRKNYYESVFKGESEDSWKCGDEGLKDVQKCRIEGAAKGIGANTLVKRARRLGRCCRRDGIEGRTAAICRDLASRKVLRKRAGAARIKFEAKVGLAPKRRKKGGQPLKTSLD